MEPVSMPAGVPPAAGAPQPARLALPTLPEPTPVLLRPERALHWPAAETLFVADLHVGKPDVFHRAGIPVPAAVTIADLNRLSAVLDATQARRLVILGDFFHAAGSRSPGVFAALEAWRARHADLSVLLVAGNHDRHAGPPPTALAIEPCGDELVAGPFHCIHAPPAAPPVSADADPLTAPARYTLCGHIHPVAVLSEAHNGGRSGAHAARLPCFHVTPHRLTLPAFGAFTGGKAVSPVRGDRIFVVAGDAVLPVPLAA